MNGTMTKEEVSRRYQIPTEVLDEYQNWGLCGAVRMAMEDWRYDDSDLERLSLIMALHDVGFAKEEVESYMRLLLQGDKSKTERLRLLDARRQEKLEEIHLRERQLDRMDYLRYKLRNEGQ